MSVFLAVGVASDPRRARSGYCCGGSSRAFSKEARTAVSIMYDADCRLGVSN